MEFVFTAPYTITTESSTITFEEGFHLYAPITASIKYRYNHKQSKFLTTHLVAVPGTKYAPRREFNDGNLYRAVEERIARLAFLKNPSTSLSTGTRSYYLTPPKANRAKFRVVSEQKKEASWTE